METTIPKRLVDALNDVDIKIYLNSAKQIIIQSKKSPWEIIFKSRPCEDLYSALNRAELYTLHAIPIVDLI